MTEDVERKFLAAWHVFAQTIEGVRAPEATYQVWFARYLIRQFGIDRVAREPIFKHLHAGSAWQVLVPGGEVKLDAVISREPGIDLPHYVHRGGDGAGMHTLGDLAVICELKVASSAGGGLDHREVAQDVYKLSLLFEQADARGLQSPWRSHASSTTTPRVATAAPDSISASETWPRLTRTSAPPPGGVSD